MCTYYYLHYHHMAPCTREVEYALHYYFCPNSTTEAPGSSPLGPVDGSNMEGTDQLVQLPCDDLTYAPEYNPIEGIDYNNPCATGGCLLSQQCSSGGCRLEDLGGRWVCCKCERGGNSFRWCVHPMKRIPDTLCYHVVCHNCRADM
ncbi:Uu.00g133310.m01.CDS01 [Anthostomella pinea]|uniref:Uu.00g133310.m01.CDS01 n=1 Tax=Anthostomella pinea TaxID=933095 RepID=A0AAI8VT02_9PEZI|nr:Uu.00g133310.m01.CDS01 [Anthostomella pinea]